MRSPTIRGRDGFLWQLLHAFFWSMSAARKEGSRLCYTRAALYTCPPAVTLAVTPPEGVTLRYAVPPRVYGVDVVSRGWRTKRR
ncbi:hypothetical protein FOMPIDRAFT_1026024 [Fomitopsis schrenkii]|uniref:Secreted protein n=1 Tax=Fomitopsis schrenkii TaxID=2126942 RepID=S8EZD5_FOMSC|nr:hypothetical protein FOMPIDRAFT_1026024 [Fomitopsis schrenkii]